MTKGQEGRVWERNGGEKECRQQQKIICLSDQNNIREKGQESNHLSPLAAFYSRKSGISTYNLLGQCDLEHHTSVDALKIVPPPEVNMCKCPEPEDTGSQGSPLRRPSHHGSNIAVGFYNQGLSTRGPISLTRYHKSCQSDHLCKIIILPPLACAPVSSSEITKRPTVEEQTITWVLLLNLYHDHEENQKQMPERNVQLAFFK